MNFVAIGIGAGLASALLIAAVTQGTALALALFMLSPVPIIVAALGWDHRAGLVATLVGGIAIAVLSTPLSGLSFAFATGLPSWWLAYLALLGRTREDGTVEWYPLGRLLAWIGGTAALTFFAAAIFPDFDFEQYRQTARDAAEAVVRMQAGIPASAPLTDIGEVPVEEVISRIAAITPIIGTVGFTFVMLLYIWIGARIVSASGRLARPWPAICEAVMPRETIFILVGATVAGMALGGFPGVLAYALVGGLLTAFGIQGLGAIHDLSRGRAGRGFIVALTYIVLFLSQGIALIPLIFFGLVDSAFGLRERMRAGAGGRNGPNPFS
ncbi:MAG: DUF2232 domain-containing protein [Salinarimonadaceae bacterium]|nr:MAG: DUF2232 domain-containing protein [Salinarimonadaceae bacterium]